MYTVTGNLVDITNKTTYAAQVTIKEGKIERVEKIDATVSNYILPGFVDAHIHIESSMLVPSEFARLAVIHGTVGTISDPHEIANVLGVPGVQFMIENGKKVPFKFHFGAPSCVPATNFETAGAVIDSDGIKELLASPDIYYLAEMMNYPGVLFDDEEVLKKIAWAKHYNKPVDGHAPGLMGDDAKKYASAGITTDHECFTYEETKGKLELGMKILIREGSAAKNFNALIPLLADNYKNMMFCSDDKHPDDLVLGHINQLCARAVAYGVDVYKVLQAACINPVKHYNMNIGLLQEGDAADFIIVEDLKDFKVLETYINGTVVAKEGTSDIHPVAFDTPNNFNTSLKTVSDFTLSAATTNPIRVIEALDGELITNEIHCTPKVVNGNLVSDTENDILKMTVVNRYSNTPPAIAFIKNFGLKEGAIAGSVGHDSHNIIAVGTSDEALCKAVNTIIENTGGICATDSHKTTVLPLPVAGIISDKDGWETGTLYETADAHAKALGSTLKAPFMTLSFMALLVIPDLKLSDKGLFSGKKFEFTSLNV
ncbi:adenine deaminase [Neptunitalea lumnitzerae]|uniref:Adenine deaminase n=1 Tax=Neptunitalea lumnitzerae TaxID=2965509 RepID=A0ABQ5MI44_9FLAO|nr:adenine deaminase [Neptunitalea sp. Y10]GLB48710.1 adenine deaminase [Neptunitalea sp. Y10]